jgi:diguanylate cyclase (GGDEF)-like protein
LVINKCCHAQHISLRRLTASMKAFSPAVDAEPATPSDSSFLARTLEVVRPDSVSRFTIVLLLYIGASWGGNALTRTPAVADLIWPANGMLLAFLLPIAKRYWSAYLTSSIVVNIAVHLAFGFSPGRTLLYTVANTVEVIIAAALLATKDHRKPDLTNLRTLGRFLLFGVLLAPFASTGFMEMILAVWTYPRHPLLLANWFTGDVMGIALMTPLFLAIDKAELIALFMPKKRWETAGILAAIAFVSILVFTQTGLPIDFLIIPVLLLAVFRLRATGTAIGILVMAAPAVYMTERAHGVFVLSGATLDQHGFFILQLFLCVNLVIVYAVNAALGIRDKMHQEMTAAFHEADALATQDYATGLANRFSFDRQLALEWENAARQQNSLALLMVDIDHFKLYNDHYGHLAGDDCLRRIAAIMADASLRSCDLVARYGGEEFAVILPRATAQGAVALAERMRQLVADAQIAHMPYTPGIVTVSIGVASMIPDMAGDETSLIQHADRALYSAKRAGRNRAECYQNSFEIEYD